MFTIHLQEHTIPLSASEISPLLELSGCGVQRNLSAEMNFETSDYAVFYMWKGSGDFTVNNRTHALYDGDFLVCRPHESKTFVPHIETSAHFYHFSFNGKFSPEILSKLNLTSRDKYFVGHDNELTLILDKMIDEQNTNDPTSVTVRASLLTLALGLMSRLAIHILPQDQSKGYEKIAPALNSIHSDCTSKIGVDDYAKMCNLSTSYFTHLFTKIIGYSPIEYKQLQRIAIAKNLLSTTNLSVKEIATVIGFKDPLYFGRCFKQSTGKTPSGYRSKK